MSVFGIAIVSGSSMVPTYHHNDILIQSNVPYMFGEPEVNDIVIVDMPREIFGQEEYIIKRIVAVEGDTVEIKNNKFYRNDKEVKENYINEPMEEDKDQLNTFTGKHTLKEGEVFVMGDNRNHSADSRYFGAVPVEFIEGKVIVDNEGFSSVMQKFYRFIGKIKDEK